MRTQEKKWTGRVRLLHVEAHRHKEAQRRKKRKITQLEQMNYYADTFVDYPYEAHVVEFETNYLPKRKNCCQI